MENIPKYKLPIGILCAVLAILILLQSCLSEHWWFGFTYEIDEYKNNKSATIVKINYPSEKVVIPSTICFREVRSLGGYVTGYNLWGAERKGMFEDNDITKEIVVSEGIEYIGDRCFYNCIYLESVQLPSTIKQFSFANCKELKNVNFNDDVKEIERLSFSGCSSLETLEIPNNIIENGISYGDFDGCKSLNQLILPKNISSIGRSSFENCTTLEKVVVYDKVEYIGDNTFEGCDNLTIYGIKGSYAEQYANEHNIPFEELK